MLDSAKRSTKMKESLSSGRKIFGVLNLEMTLLKDAMLEVTGRELLLKEQDGVTKKVFREEFWPVNINGYTERKLMTAQVIRDYCRANNYLLK
jgi:hypothetical protein